MQKHRGNCPAQLFITVQVCDANTAGRCTTAGNPKNITNTLRDCDGH